MRILSARKRQEFAKIPGALLWSSAQNIICSHSPWNLTEGGQLEQTRVMQGETGLCGSGEGAEGTAVSTHVLSHPQILSFLD